MRARLIQFHDIGTGIRHFVFKAVDLDNLTFEPGQFVSFSEVIGEKKVTRAYSIASPPAPGNHFELCLNRVEEGAFSPYLFRMNPGDELDMKGPLGGFVWKKELRDSILVATGTGIAPIRSMLLDRVPKDDQHHFTLIFGVRFEQNLLYADDFRRLAAEYRHFDFRPTVTRPTERWQERTGRVQPYLLEALGDRRDVDVYVCGLRAMVDDVRNTLKSLGFDRKQIIYERFD